jgi:serine/threonine-protein kinase
LLQRLRRAAQQTFRFAACRRRTAAPQREGGGVVVGEVVLGRFHVEQRLGSGGFGVVYRAWDTRLERDVAVKVLEPDGELGDRVLREAQAAARLNHRGIATLYELGEEGGRTYLVSELVAGRTLRRLSVDGQLGDRDVGEIGADLCEALDHAHSRGVVHRDVKPQNVVVCEREAQAKLLDFGVARMTDAASLTATGDVVGTLAYMSPEQAEGEPAGPESDVFALALTLYECWSGVNPHLRSTPAATARTIGSPLPSLGRRRRDLPRGLVETVDAALDPTPDRRPSLEELGGAIEASLGQLDPRPRGGRRGASLRARLGPGPWEGAALDTATAAVLTGLLAAAFATVGWRGPAWTLLLLPLVAALAVLRPRLGYLTAALGLAAWLGLAAGRPGAALVLLVLTVPPLIALPDCGRGLIAPAAAPALGALGLALAYPVLAALAARWRERAVLAAAGAAWLAAAEVVLGRRLLLGPAVDPPPGWQESAGKSVSGLIAPLFGAPRVLATMAAAAAVAVLAGVLLAPFRARLRGEAGARRAATAPAGPAAHGGPGRGGERQPTLS